MGDGGMDCKDWSLPRSDSLAQREWGAFLVDAGLTQQQAVDMEQGEFERIVGNKVEDDALREQLSGRRQDLWNQFFGFDSSGRRASVATSGMRGVEQTEEVIQAGAARRDSIEVLKGLWTAFLAEQKMTEQDCLALTVDEFEQQVRQHTEDPVLAARLNGHREDLWGAFFGFESRRGSMTDITVRRASLQGTFVQSAGMTPFQWKKHERVFRMKDFDGNGLMNSEDFQIWGRKFAENMGCEFSEEISKAYKETYDTYIGGENMTMDAWIVGVGKFYESQGSAILDVCRSINKDKMFKAIAAAPKRAGGDLGFDEYFAFVQPLGTTEEAARAAFKLIDTDHSGGLSPDELAEAAARYYLDPEPSRYQHFYGEWNP